jgi:hypothetical protein
MMHRWTKLLGSGGQEYFNEKRPVNWRVDGALHVRRISSASDLVEGTYRLLSPCLIHIQRVTSALRAIVFSQRFGTGFERKQ